MLKPEVFPKFRSLTAMAAAIALTIMLSGCNHGSPASARTEKPVIAVSIFPVASLVQQLTGNWADVVTLLPTGASEHHAELTADQTRQLGNADLLIVVGMGLDGWAEKSTAGLPHPPTVVRMADLLQGELRKPVPPPGKNKPAEVAKGKTEATKETDQAHEHAAPNAHLWLDPVLARRFVEKLADVLKQKYPPHAAEIQAAAALLSDNLKDLDEMYREQLLGVRRELITFHNAFDLIARRYGLEVVAHLTDLDLDPGGEISFDSFSGAVRAAEKYHLAVIYSEPEFSDREVNSLRRRTGVELLSLDPLGGPTIEHYRTYQEMMRSNLDTLVTGQSRPAKPETKKP